MFFDRVRTADPDRSSWQRRLTAVLCTLTLLMAMAGSAGATTTQARSEEEDGKVSPTMDALFLRPLGLYSLAVGIVLFVPAAALTLITRPTDINKPFKALIVDPALYVWADPLGEH